MKIFLIVITVLFVSGCKPNKMDKEVAEYICHDKGGVYAIYRIAIENRVVHCKNNTAHSPVGVVIPANFLKPQTAPKNAKAQNFGFCQP